MRTKRIFAFLAAIFASAALCAAADANMGTWKLNAAKSKLAPGMTRYDTVVYEAVGDKVKITGDGVDGQGNPVHGEWTSKYDGKDYPVTGDANSNTRSYKKIDDHTLMITSKKDGKVTTTTRIVVASDGKSRTVTTTGTDAKGMKVTNVSAYDKQ